MSNSNYIVFCLISGIIVNCLNAQVFSVKKHNFSVQIGNATLDCQTPITNYSYSTPYNDIREDFEVHNQSSVINPRLGAEYNLRLWTNTKDLRSSYLMFACELSYLRQEYNRTKFGTHSGGYTQYYFEGTVKERFSSRFFTHGIGIKYYAVTPMGKILGIAVNINRHHDIGSHYFAEYHNDLDNRTWTQTLGGSTSQVSWKQKVNIRLKWPRDYFSCNVTLSAGKNLGKMFHLGVFLQYSMPEYLFYRNTPKPDVHRMSFTSSSSYLTYFNIITYGIYFML